MLESHSSWFYICVKTQNHSSQTGSGMWVKTLVAQGSLPGRQRSYEQLIVIILVRSTHPLKDCLTPEAVTQDRDVFTFNVSSLFG